MQWLPLKYSNIYRINAIGRAVRSVGAGVFVGVLTAADVAMFEGLMDEIAAVRNAECQ